MSLTDRLPNDIRSRKIPNINGLTIHILESGYDILKPCIILLHGFPELAFSWRYILPRLAKHFYVVAPDLRGFGQTTGWDTEYDGDLRSFRVLNHVRDIYGLVNALGCKQVGIVGHDVGSTIASYCALLRPDVFVCLAIMSSPFSGPPSISSQLSGSIHRDLASLPRPRKYYQVYFCGREANDDMLKSKLGLRAFLRAYFFFKSAKWEGNHPYKLTDQLASELSRLPEYYVMDLDENMSETIEAMLSRTQGSAESIREWLAEDDLAVYASEYERTGFQGGLNFYRCQIDGECQFTPELQLFSGMCLTVPTIYIAGEKDWGTYQTAGVFDDMQSKCGDHLQSIHFVENAGHWVQQEQPAKVAELLELFFEDKLL